MNFGQIRTAVFGIIGETKEPISLFQFGEAFDAAQLQFCSMMPLEAIPELMMTTYADRAASVLSEGSIQLPKRFFALEFVQFATERDGDGSVSRRSARIVDPSEFEMLTSFGASERIASATGHLVRFSPTPAPSGDSGDPKAIKLVYKMRPRYFMAAKRWQTNGTFPSLYQHNDSPRLFDVLAWDGGPRTLSALGVDSEEDMIGGRVFIGGPDPFTDYNITVHEATIVDCYVDSDTSRVVVVVSDDDAIPVPDDATGTTRRRPCLVLPRKIGEAGTSILSDDDIPDFDDKWHPHLVDLTAVRLLAGIKRYNEAGAQLQFLNQKIAAMGVDVFFTMPETPEEEGR